VYPFDSFNEDAKRTLTLAQEEAERAHQSYIGTEHLLLGLLRNQRCVAAEVLTRLGVEIETTREVIRTVLGQNRRRIIQEITPTSRVKQVIVLAFEESRRSGANLVGTEHLLLGLMIEGEGIAAHVLNDMGVTLDVVRQTIREHPVPPQESGSRFRPGARVLVHDGEPPHRLWEGIVLSATADEVRVRVVGHPATEEFSAGLDKVHAIPPRVGSCPYCGVPPAS
jgi:ATP-dependent Clp protease ATP-binding subunit ClpA